MCENKGAAIFPDVKGTGCVWMIYWKDPPLHLWLAKQKQTPKSTCSLVQLQFCSQSESTFGLNPPVKKFYFGMTLKHQHVFFCFDFISGWQSNLNLAHYRHLQDWWDIFKLDLSKSWFFVDCVLTHPALPAAAAAAAEHWRQPAGDMSLPRLLRPITERERFFKMKVKVWNFVILRSSK